MKTEEIKEMFRKFPNVKFCWKIKGQNSGAIDLAFSARLFDVEDSMCFMSVTFPYSIKRGKGVIEVYGGRDQRIHLDHLVEAIEKMYGFFIEGTVYAHGKDNPKIADFVKEG